MLLKSAVRCITGRFDHCWISWSNTKNWLRHCLHGLTPLITWIAYMDVDRCSRSTVAIKPDYKAVSPEQKSREFLAFNLQLVLYAT